MYSTESDIQKDKHLDYCVLYSWQVNVLQVSGFINLPIRVAGLCSLKVHEGINPEEKIHHTAP